MQSPHLEFKFSPRSARFETTAHKKVIASKRPWIRRPFVLFVAGGVGRDQEVRNSSFEQISCEQIRDLRTDDLKNGGNIGAESMSWNIDSAHWKLKNGG
jgi:hypothetical protein